MGTKQEDQEMKKELREYLKESFFFEHGRLSNRTDWFLIFHAILFEAFFTSKIECHVLAILAGIGVLTSYIWLVNGIRFRKNLAQIGVYMDDDNLMGDGTDRGDVGVDSPISIAEIHKRMFADRKNLLKRRWLYSWAKDVPSFGVAFPVIFLCAWIGITWFTFPFCLLIVFVVLILIISLFIYKLDTGVKKTREEMKNFKKKTEHPTNSPPF